MNTSDQILFGLIDQKLDDATEAIRKRIFSVCRDMPWTPDQRKNLRPLVRQELETLILKILKLFDNVGGVLPDEVSGWTINNAEDGTDIAVNNADYADMWRDYLSYRTNSSKM